MSCDRPGGLVREQGLTWRDERVLCTLWSTAAPLAWTAPLRSASAMQQRVKSVSQSGNKSIKLLNINYFATVNKLGFFFTVAPETVSRIGRFSARKKTLLKLMPPIVWKRRREPSQTSTDIFYPSKLPSLGYIFIAERTHIFAFT